MANKGRTRWPRAWIAIITGLVDPQRKRKIRLVAALSVAVLLAVALIYTSFSASTEAKEPSQLLGAAPGTSYEMTGRVVKGSIERDGSGIAFRVVDRDGEGARAAGHLHRHRPRPVPRRPRDRPHRQRSRAAPSSASRTP